MSISACILIKNEALLIKDCIAHLKELVEEIIVVDNGSTDSSMEIASQLGAKVFRDTDGYQDEVRNKYISEATEPWLLILDADERITEEAVAVIKKVTEQCAPELMGFRLPRYEYTGAGKWATTEVLRVIRKHPGIKYQESKIHSSPGPSIQQQGGIIESIGNAPIHHLDLLVRHDSLEKRRKYTELLHMEISKGDDKLAGLLPFLGIEYAALGNYEEAEACYKRAIALNEEYPYGRLFLAQLYLHLNRLPEAVEAVATVLKNHKRMKDRAAVILTEVELRRGNRSIAKSLALQALEEQPFMAHHYLNLAYLTEDQQESEKYLKQALQLNPWLGNRLIYKDVDIPNTYSLQNSLLSCVKHTYETFNILKHPTATQ